MLVGELRDVGFATLSSLADHSFNITSLPNFPRSCSTSKPQDTECLLNDTVSVLLYRQPLPEDKIGSTAFVLIVFPHQVNPPCKRCCLGQDGRRRRSSELSVANIRRWRWLLWSIYLEDENPTP